MKKFLFVVMVVVVSQALFAEDTWYVNQEYYKQGFCIPAYVDSLDNIILLNMNFISFGGLFIPLDDDWKEISIGGVINAEFFRYALMSHQILPYEELIFRDDLQKVIVVFKEAENFRDTFLIKIVPVIPGNGEYSLREIEEKDFSQRVIFVDENKPMPVFIRKK